jgi:hypothetical protein
MTSEKENNVFWALKRLRDLLRCPYNVNVIVTNPTQALMNVVDKVFPKSIVMLCGFQSPGTSKKIARRNAK